MSLFLSVFLCLMSVEIIEIMRGFRMDLTSIQTGGSLLTFNLVGVKIGIYIWENLVFYVTSVISILKHTCFLP